MNRSGDRLRRVVRFLCAWITSLSCVLLLGINHAFADAALSVEVENIVVVGTAVFSQNEKTPLRDEMLQLVSHSEVVNKENIENIAVNYLASRFGEKAKVTSQAKALKENTYPRGRNLRLKIVFTAWPQIIDGQRVTIGALAIHLRRHEDGYGDLCIQSNHPEFQPVDTFIITDDDAQTQRNIESAVARLLDRYSTIQKIQQ